MGGERPFGAHPPIVQKSPIRGQLLVKVMITMHVICALLKKLRDIDYYVIHTLIQNLENALHRVGCSTLVALAQSLLAITKILLNARNHLDDAAKIFERSERLTRVLIQRTCHYISLSFSTVC